MTSRVAPSGLRFALILIALGAIALCAGSQIGSEGWQWTALWTTMGGDAASSSLVWDIRLPRSLGAWLAGALLGLAGAVAQGLFRNPLADPYLLGSASGATLGVSLVLAFLGAAPVGLSLWLGLGLTGAAFVGAVIAVMMTIALARGVQHSLRLLLAGVIVGVVLGALASLVLSFVPEVMVSMQGFMLGNTAFVGWPGVALMLVALIISLIVAVLAARALDALSLGEATAVSLGLPLVPLRWALVLAMSLATGAAVAQVGLVAFVGLAAPHLVRSRVRVSHRALVILSALMGALLLLVADLGARGLLAPRELPIGVLTAVCGGGYLLWLMHRRSLGGAGSGVKSL
jgi:iron complex transport system permease protein